MSQKSFGILTKDNFLQKKALLFINGQPPKTFPDLGEYSIIACTDGAFLYLEDKKFPLEKINFISGDFDSHLGWKDSRKLYPFIFTPDQEKTDFEKALEIIFEKGIVKVDVFGGSGGEMDHYLGNLHVALSFKNKMDIHFFDDYSEYFFAANFLEIPTSKNQTISLYPFPKAEGISTKGLNWELELEDLEISKRMGIRNFAKGNTVKIEFTQGNLLIFVHY
jgi:thiamine pyrophosphokinase